MPTVFLSPLIKQRFYDITGTVPLANGTVTTYTAGTLVLAITYADATGTVANTNPVILDGGGSANIWLDSTKTYKYIVKDSAGSTIHTIDNISVGVTSGNAASALTIAGGVGGEVLVQSAVDVTAKIANGTAGQVFTSNGTTALPTWESTTASATLAANTFTAEQNFARATVASAATTSNIWTGGNQIDFTGTATVTNFPAAPQAGTDRVLICAAACSFTASANMLIDGVASAATLTCVANDQVIVRAISTTQFKLTRVKYDGTAQVVAPAGGSMIFISAITATAANTVEFATGIDSTYDRYVITIDNLYRATTASTTELYAQLYSNGAYVAGANYTSNVVFSNFQNTTYAALSYYSYAYAVLTAPSAIPPVGSQYNGVVELSGGNFGYTAIRARALANGAKTDSDTIVSIGAGAPVTRIKFYLAAGTMNGTFRLYGISKT